MTTKLSKQQIDDARKAALQRAIESALIDLAAQIDAYCQNDVINRSEFATNIRKESEVALPNQSPKKRTSYFEQVELRVNGFDFRKERRKDSGSESISNVAEATVFDHSLQIKMDNLTPCSYMHWKYVLSFGIPVQSGEVESNEKEWRIYRTAYPYVTISMVKRKKKSTEKPS